MIGIADHKWGDSPAVDRVWAEVCGLRPSTAGKRLFLVVQAYIDDSCDDDGTYVLAGGIAEASAWASFTGEWEALLKPLGTHKKGDIYHFKMSEMAQSDERMERVPAFLRVIEDNIPLFVSCALNVRDLRSATRRIWNPLTRFEWVDAHNPFIMSFRFLMDMFHTNSHILELPFLTQPVDFYFDEQSEKRYIFDGWDEYMRGRPEGLKHLYGSTPRFVDDEKFLPLQAADLWAWWVRKWTVDREIDTHERPKFGRFERRQDLIWMHISLTEDDILMIFADAIRREAPHLSCLYDANTGELIPFPDPAGGIRFEFRD